MLNDELGGVGREASRGGLMEIPDAAPLDAKSVPAFSVGLKGWVKQKAFVGDSKDHVFYALNILSNSNELVFWTVLRRYTAFVKLHEDLKTMLPKKIKLPTLPGKALVRSFNENYVQKKGNQLEEYLRFLLAIPEVYAIDEFMSFLLGNYDTLGSVFAALDQANGRYEGIHQEQLTTLKTDYERTIADLDGEIATNKATITSKAEIINEKNSVISQFSRANEEFRSIIAALKQDVSTAETLAAEAKEARLELLEEMTNHQRRKESSSASNSSKQFKTTPKNSHNQAISDANTALEIEALQSRLALAEAEAREVSGALKKIKLEKKVLIKEVKKLRKTIEGGGGGAEDTKVSQ